MKNNSFKLVMFGLGASASGLMAQSVVGSGGRSVAAGSVCLSYTIGEAVISPAAVSGTALHGGYQLPSRFDFWTTSLGLLGGPTGDPDADGAVNLVEYATGTNPNSAASVSRPQSSIGPGDKLYISMGKDPLRTDVLWTVQGSKNLVSWSAAEVSTSVNDSSSLLALFTGTAPGFLRIQFSVLDGGMK
jgi:hypothetical protein